MNKLRLYLDTTIWNYPFETHSPERTGDTLEFFKRVRMGSYDIFSSEMVIFEIEATRTSRRTQMMDLFAEVAPFQLEFRQEIEVLAKRYLERKVLPKKSRMDALHIAYSTLYQMDALVSWNFQHLANMERRQRAMAVNIEMGYNFPIQLVTPLEVMDNAQDD